MRSRPIKVLWLDANHKQNATEREMGELRKFEPLYGCSVEATADVQDSFNAKVDYVMICSSGSYKKQAELLKPKQYNLLGVIIYCKKVAQHKGLQDSPYVVLVTDSFRQVEKQLLNLISEGDYEFGEESEGANRFADLSVQDEQNRFVVVGRNQQQNSAQFYDPQDYERKKRNILQLFNLQFDCEKDLQLTKKHLQHELRSFLKSKSLLPLEREFDRLRQVKSMQELVRLCVYLYSLEKANLYTSLNIILKNLRMIRFQQDFQRLRLFAFLLLLNYFHFYGQSEFFSTAYRFTDFVPEGFKEGSIVTVCNFYSTSKKDDLEAFRHKKTKIIIETYDHASSGSSLAFFNYLSASKYSAYKQQQELLFAPFTKFKVTKVVLSEKQNEVYMKELPINSFLSRIYDLNLLPQNQQLKSRFDRQLNYQSKYEKLLKARKLQSSKEAAACYRNLGVLYTQHGDYSWALDYFNRSLVVALQLKDSQNLAVLRNNIGLLYSKMGKHAQALTEFDKAIQFRKQESQQSRSLINVMNNKASLMESMGKYENSLQLYQQALQICRQSYPERHFVHANLLNNIGFVLMRLGREGDALAHFTKAVSIFEYVQGQLSEYVAICYQNMAELYQKLKQDSKCEQYYNKAIQIEKEVKGSMSPNLQNMYCSLGKLYNTQRNYQSAKECFGKALQVCITNLGPTHQQTAMLYNNIGSLEQSMGNPEQALTYFERALDLLYRVYKNRNQDIIQLISINVSDLKSKLQQGFFKK